MVKRALLTAICLSWLAGPALAQVPGAPATLIMRSGDRISAEVIDIAAPGLLIRENGQERNINLADVAIIEFAGSANPNRSIRSGLGTGHQYIVLRNGQVVEGHLKDIGGNTPKILYVDTPSGERQFNSNEVAQVYMAAPAGNVQAVGTAGRGSSASFSVPANQQWTETAIIVREGEMLSLRVDGEISFGPNDRATAAGVPRGTRGSGTPLPSAPAGALIGRVDDGQPFIVGRQTTVRMPASGRLFLGINDDVVSDNSGEFQVIVTPTARRR
jgi:hypothetical protein